MVITEQLPGNEEDLTYQSIRPKEVAMEYPFQSIQTQQQVRSSICLYARLKKKLKSQISSSGRLPPFFGGFLTECLENTPACVSTFVEKVEEQRWF